MIYAESIASLQMPSKFSLINIVFSCLKIRALPWRFKRDVFSPFCFFSPFFLCHVEMQPIQAHFGPIDSALQILEALLAPLTRYKREKSLLRSVTEKKTPSRVKLEPVFCSPLRAPSFAVACNRLKPIFSSKPPKLLRNLGRNPVKAYILKTDPSFQPSLSDFQLNYFFFFI